MVMKNLLYFLLLFIVIACNNDDDITAVIDPIETNVVSINGVVQKGPFSSGTNITILELDQNLQQTGRTFYTTTLGNKGEFAFPEVSLESEYVELIADGSFFNEVTATTPDSRIILKAVSSVNGNGSISNNAVNVNILTTLTAERIIYLVQEEGLSFLDARLKAQNEVLNIFGFDNVGDQNFEDFDFSESGITSNQLLAISGIILGIKNNQELTEFLTEFAFDIKEDGILNSDELNIDLITSAVTCAVGQIRVNLRDFYNDGTTYAGFQSYVEDFKNFSTYNSSLNLNHPINNDFGINLLPKLDMDILDANQDYCISQNIIADNLNITDIYGFDISIAQISGTGSYTMESTNEFQGWTWIRDVTIYINNNSQFQGEVMWLSSPYDNPEETRTPIKINFEGEGEILVRFAIQIGVFPYGETVYTIDKYLKW